MIPLGLDDVARLCPGKLERAPTAIRVTGVEIDSRRIARGDLFVAVGAGGAFVRDALAAGASAALVPDDAFAALAALGAEVRGRSHARVVAITGSTGKTSTKDILAAICASHARTVAAEASFNNELGVPLTLCRIAEDTDVCIVELAMRGLGQIAELASLARPEIGVVTNVGAAHLELVGSVAEVARAKGELVEALPAGGVAIVPAAFPITRDDLEVVRIDEPDARIEGGRTIVRFGDREIAFSFRARHQAQNALVALLVARALGIDADDEVEVDFSRWRGEEVELAGGGLLINDCYNANPASMSAALTHLADCSEGRRMVAVLGEMAELGASSPDFHREVGRQASELGIDVLVAVGPLARHYLETASEVPDRAWTATSGEAAGAALSAVRPGDCVLVKASRAVGLEAVADALSAGRI